MRILIVAYYYSDWRGGGSEQNIVNMSKYLMKEGHDCSVAVPSTARTRLLEEAGIRYFRVGEVRSLSPFKFLKSVRQIVSVLKNNQIDLIQILTFRLLMHVYLATKLAAIKKIWQGMRFIKIPIVVDMSRGWKEIDKYFLPIIGMLVDKIIALSKYCEDKFKRSRFTRSKVVRIWRGAEVDRFTSVFEKRSSEREFRRKRLPQVVGTVGRLTSEKAVHYILRAAELILRKQNVRFLIVGEGQDEEMLKSLSNQLGIQDKVSFMGRREDIPEILGGMDVFVSSSVFEGMPQALLEAMAAGLPVVATDVQGHSEAVLDGVSGILVPLGDVGKMAEAIEKLLDDRELAFKMGQVGRSRAVEYFDINNSCEKTKDVFEGLVG